MKRVRLLLVAVAVGFTLQVVEPHLNGPLGEAPIEKPFDVRKAVASVLNKKT